MLATQNNICNTAYVINLDRSTERWYKVSKELERTGMSYQRFSAVDGYKITLKSVENGKVVTGQQLKDHNLKLNPNSIFEVTCNPEDEKPTQFHYKGRSITAGEFGVWCSNIRIWELAAKNQCQNTIIFEDDIVIKTGDFSNKFNQFINYLPKKYDLAWIDAQKWGKFYSNPHNSYVKKFSPYSHWCGAYAYMLNLEAAEKLLSTNSFSGPIDTFLEAVIKNDIAAPYSLDGYISTVELLGVIVAEGHSEIHKMGREH